MNNFSDIFLNDYPRLVQECHRLADDIETDRVTPGRWYLEKQSAPCCALGHLLSRLDCPLKYEDVDPNVSQEVIDFQFEILKLNDNHHQSELISFLRSL